MKPRPGYRWYLTEWDRQPDGSLKPRHFYMPITADKIEAEPAPVEQPKIITRGIHAGITQGKLI